VKRDQIMCTRCSEVVLLWREMSWRKDCM